MTECPEADRRVLATAGRVLHAQGLVDAFGHVSVRRGRGLVITPPRPLGSLDPEGTDWPYVDLDADVLPAGTPKEAWIHVALMRRRPEVVAVCRAQPAAVTAVVAAGRDVVPLHGQAATIGPVGVYPDSRLIRDREPAEAVATAMAQGRAVVLRGNGAVTVGPSVAEAVVAMVLLEASARMNVTAAGLVREPLTGLSEAEHDYWLGVAPEIHARLWEHLAATAASTNGTGGSL